MKRKHTLRLEVRLEPYDTKVSRTVLRGVRWSNPSILPDYVQQKSGDYRPQFSRTDIRATVEAIARKDESCVLTGKLIQEEDPMYLGLTIYGDFVPLSLESINEEEV